MLGWRHAKAGKKGLPFALAFDVLGLNLHLEALGRGVLSLTTKRDDWRRSQGLLTFASGFYAGRALAPFARSLSRLADQPGSDGLAQWASGLLNLLRGAKPRELSGRREDRVIIFTDGSWENEKSGLGSIMFDPTDGFAEVLSGECPPALIQAWENQVGKQVIYQLRALHAGPIAQPLRLQA